MRDVRAAFNFPRVGYGGSASDLNKLKTIQNSSNNWNPRSAAKMIEYPIKSYVDETKGV